MVVRISPGIIRNLFLLITYISFIKRNIYRKTTLFDDGDTDIKTISRLKVGDMEHR